MSRALKNYITFESASVEDARQRMSTLQPDLIILDINLPGISGLEYLREIVSKPSAPPVVMITAHGSERTAVEAIKAGAYDYVAKPYEIDELRLVVKNALDTWSLKRENRRLQAELRDARGAGDLLGTSDQMKRIHDLIARVAATDVTVLLTGESGTGKELVARAIHERSAERRSGGYVAMNCAALPSELIESELFGHEKGAFTGAANQRKGKFELASGGTIFLDEVGDMSMATQAKLLRVLEERSIERLGGSQLIPVDVRVISATNRDLSAAVAAEKFRPDLYYRLKVVEIQLPPLRERRNDIPQLAAEFLRSSAERFNLRCVEIGRETLSRLVAYDWPGNVRELRNVIERSAVLADGPEMEVRDLPEEVRARRVEVVRTGGNSDSVSDTRNEGDSALNVPFLNDFREARREFERAYIERCLVETGGNVTKAAEKIGMHRQSLQQKLKDLGLARRYVTAEEVQETSDD